MMPVSVRCSLLNRVRPYTTASLALRVFGGLAMTLLSAPAQAQPLLIHNASGTVLSGRAEGWTLGPRTLVIRSDRTAGVLTQGQINAQGQFRLPLPGAALLRPLTQAAGVMYDVLGCDDQSSDFDVSNREARLYWLPEPLVMKAGPATRTTFERGTLSGRAVMPGPTTSVRLLYASAPTTIRIALSCTSFGTERSALYDLTLVTGWNVVLSQEKSDTLRMAPASLKTVWRYQVR